MVLENSKIIIPILCFEYVHYITQMVHPGLMWYDLYSNVTTHTTYVDNHDI